MDYEKRVRAYERQGLTTSDAQAVVDAEDLKASLAKTYFQIGIITKGLVPAGVDPRHIEGYVRLQYSTLGHLDWPTIRREVKIAIGCIKEGGVDAAERNAKSFGL